MTEPKARKMNKHGRKAGRKEGSRHACPCETSVARRLALRDVSLSLRDPLRDVCPCETSVARRLLRDPYLRDTSSGSLYNDRLKKQRRYKYRTKG